MQCPIDGTQLVMTDRAGVEIDYCPQCRGVWLDRGELDKIIERSAVAESSSGRDRRRDDDDDGYGGKRRKRRDSILSELFDF
ncbi:MAG: zf-TFIIB domain-containing protein [Paracoccaceae bacterium]